MRASIPERHVELAGLLHFLQTGEPALPAQRLRTMRRESCGQRAIRNHLEAMQHIDIDAWTVSLNYKFQGEAVTERP